MIKRLFALLLLALPLLLSAEQPISLKQKLLNANSGDYIVTHQRKIYSLLSIHKKTDHKILLEEVSIPEATYKNLKKISWKDWVKKGAIGHSMWMIYEIDLDSNEVTNIYSPSEKAHYKVATEEMFFAKLLTLPLQKVSEDQRRKIGPPPQDGERDNRLLWNPPLYKEGKKDPTKAFSVYSASYPKDGSDLSEKILNLYFADNGFSLPIWIQVDTGHYSVMLHAIDTGHNLESPAKFRPSQYPSFAPKFEIVDGEILLKIHHLDKDYFSGEYSLYAVDITNPNEKEFKQIPFTSSSERKDELTLFIQEQIVKTLLKKNHRYIWVFHPKAFPDLFIDHKEIFTW